MPSTTRRFKLRKGSRLPYLEEARIDKAKLTDYALDPGHEKGGHKALLFASALGIERTDWRYLHDQILQKLPESDATRCTPDTPWGLQWEVPILVEGRNAGLRYVVTAWLTPWKEGPYLTSTYVEKSARNRELEEHELCSGGDVGDEVEDRRATRDSGRLASGHDGHDCRGVQRRRSVRDRR